MHGELLCSDLANRTGLHGNRRGRQTNHVGERWECRKAQAWRRNGRWTGTPTALWEERRLVWTPGEEPLRWDGSANAVEEQLCDRRSLSPERCGRGNGAVAED